jgi:4'-phosphopantetheinyl transferase
MEFWQNAPAEPILLSPDQVHVWRADLPACQPYLSTLQALLSADEQSRASRFYFNKDRQRFTLARAILRVILSRYLDCSAADLQFCYSETGKPALSHPAQPLCFNLSHSDQIALYAVAWNRAVGIDIERITPNRDYEMIAARFFSASEQAELVSLPAEQRLQGFFNGWTRKEALLKAMGKGLTVPLDQFAVSLSPGLPACLLSIAWDSSELKRWMLAELLVSADYAAAVVAENEWQLQAWQFVPYQLV